jgi:hypothetical protein
MRPIILLALPPVLWATLVISVTSGCLVAVSSNFAVAFQTSYNFSSWQAGLCFIPGIVGALLGVLAGGLFQDWTVEFFTRRNGGIREPEFRLSSIMTGVQVTEYYDRACGQSVGITAYGFGIQKNLHWRVSDNWVGVW